MLTASQVTHAPQRWRAAGAMNFPDFWATCAKHREANHPISIEVFIALCWEETFCSNMAQGGKPIALGPGQLLVSEDEKVYYFAGLDIVDQKTPRENFLVVRWDTSLTTWAVGKDLKVSLRSASILPASLGLKPMTKDDVLGNNDFAIKMQLALFRLASERPRTESGAYQLSQRPAGCTDRRKQDRQPGVCGRRQRHPRGDEPEPAVY